MSNNIEDYRDRMTAPIGATRLDPKTLKPIKNEKNDKNENKKPDAKKN